MYRTFYLPALLLFISSLSFAQPDITLSKTVGTGGTESIHDMIADHDGHLIALGQCDSVDRDTSCHYHGGSSDIWLVKMDAEGNILWQKCFGGSEDDFAYQIIETRDSGFLFVGWTYSGDGDVTVFNESFTCWLVKIDSNGNIDWQQGLYGGQAIHLMQLKDGRFIVSCYTANTTDDFPVHYGGGFQLDAWIWLLTESGEKDTSFHYGGSSDDVINDVIELPNGNWQMFGYTISTDYDLAGTTAYGNRDGWILRTDSNGAILWQQRYGDASPNQIVGATVLSGGNFLTAGSTNGSPDVWVMKLDSLGSKIVDYVYGGGGTDAMRDRLRIHQINSDLFAIGALSSGGGGDVGIHYGFNDFWCLTVDSNGALVNSVVSGGSNPDEPYTNNLFNANEVLQSGLTGSDDFDIPDYHGNGDGWFIKVSNFTLAGEIKDQRKLVSVFPNPLHEQFTIASTDPELLRNARLEIRDVNGALLLTRKIHQNAEEVTVQGLQAGTYLFVLRNRQQHIIASGKLIIQ
ncbi:MAG: T9SS type A sorting domain-containing protein [Chitinophagales bacterium]|nr:T9SS type A sorting domain-containing protein [Chitinophagales bacterium]